MDWGSAGSAQPGVAVLLKAKTAWKHLSGEVDFGFGFDDKHNPGHGAAAGAESQPGVLQRRGGGCKNNFAAVGTDKVKTPLGVDEFIFSFSAHRCAVGAH